MCNKCETPQEKDKREWREHLDRLEKFSERDEECRRQREREDFINKHGENNIGEYELYEGDD